MFTSLSLPIGKLYPMDDDKSRELYDELMRQNWLAEDIREYMDSGLGIEDLPPMQPTAYELSSKNQTSSEGRLFGRSVIYGKEGEYHTPYMTRYWIGRLRLHIFYRGDLDPDCHDHPWDFWTFPLTSYVEEVAYGDKGVYSTQFEVVKAFRLHFRPATHTHRVIGRYQRDHSEAIYGPAVAHGKRIVTIVWRSKKRRNWGFLKNRNGAWCWTDWRSYIFGGGKSAPCE